ncbi:ribosome-associated protein [Mitsuaria sp. BK045]|uniref:ribosome silencing factor n=1 Tax=unclassified Roseateles TaxID=2626991 RepID=UPI001611037F|nr:MULTISPECIES: ribosome silencing factor [unclassified Roseateles]MBB3294397.1 ribosome-associated protein [Mitsuaria sp. BK041]MBB3363613.1 ribosome-associated protein [Mitsuaria sp. BK045]
MDIKKLERAIVDGLEDVKAQDILVFDTERLSPLFERVIIASGTSNRQTKALASSVRETVKKRGMQVMRTEGEDNGEWIIVDCGAAVVHLMQPAIRQYYHLEEIWGGKPVKLKLGNSGTKLVKASEPMDDEDEDAPKAKKAAKSAKKPAKAKSADGEAVATASKKAPTRATGTKSAAAKTTGAKTAAKKAPAAKAAATKTAAKAPAKKTTTGATAAKTARKPAAKKEVVETVKVGSKKPAVKKLSPKVAAAKPAARPAAKKAAAKPAAKKTTVKTGTKSKAKA